QGQADEDAQRERHSREYAPHPGTGLRPGLVIYHPRVLHRLAAGDPLALAELYDRYAALAYGLALRIVREAGEAEDVVQEAFVQVWRQAGRYDPARGSPEAWLCAIVRTRALDRLRRRATRRQREEEQAGPGARTPDHDSVLALRQALSALGADQRRALELAYYEGLSQAEIAQRLGQPLGTIKTRIRTGLMRLRAALEGS
ncbi:MAG TPA: sigma-70 family RNA polymerase sigma factor, partial [Vicinamibacteria bacterium]|nr:sigma-70 family RNA polymerase sigma factor [Vicinamibacteria bacterium]